MADSQALPGEALGWLFYKNSPSGAALTTGDGDGNVFFFPGSEKMTSSYQATFRAISAITDACFNKPARSVISGAQNSIANCPMAGAQTFLGQFVNGLAIGYTALGEVASLDIASPDEAECGVDLTPAAGTSWSMVELIAWRDCENVIHSVRANIARKITAANPSGGQGFGGPNPAANTVNYTLTLEANDGWDAGPGDLFPLFEDLAGGVADTRPVSMGVTFDDPDDIAELVAACSCKLAYAGLPLTAAMVAAETVPDTPLITG